MLSERKKEREPKIPRFQIRGVMEAMCVAYCCDRFDVEELSSG